MALPTGVTAPSATATTQSSGSSSSNSTIPFYAGSNIYEEPAFDTFTQQLGASSQEHVANITPGGFLRGVQMFVTSTGGVIGSGVLANDAPYSIIQSITLEDVSGGPILYPMSAYSHAMVQKYMRPWEGDPSKRGSYSASINPGFTLGLMVEVKNTLAVLANTDARAQYRIRYTLAAGNQAGPYGLTTTAPTTQPTVTIKLAVTEWAQPDLQDYLGNSIEQLPEGLDVNRFVMHEQPNLTTGDNVLRFTLVGNEIRGFVWIIRNGDANHTRIDLTDANAGGLSFRLDNRQIWKRVPSQLIEAMNDFYEFLANGTSTREVGVFAVPRFSGQPAPSGESTSQGEYWLQTVEQSNLQLEFNGPDITTQPGQFEVIYDTIAASGTIAPELEGL